MPVSGWWLPIVIEVGVIPGAEAVSCCDPPPEFPAYGEDGAGLDYDLEELRPVAGVVEERCRHDEMTGRGNGQEFGQALDQSENRSSQ